jgi:hypothetical protein
MIGMYRPTKYTSIVNTKQMNQRVEAREILKGGFM